MIYRYINMFIYIYIYILVVMVTIVGNGLGDTSSNPRRGSSHLI